MEIGLHNLLSRFILEGQYLSINVTGLVFESSTYNRKSSTAIKINSTIHFFPNSKYNRKSNAVMKMNGTIHQKSEQYA